MNYMQLIDSLPKVSDATKTNYKYKAIKCTELGINIFGPEQEIINKIKNLVGHKKNSILDYINICIVLRKFRSVPFSALTAFRNKLREENGSQISEVNKELLTRKLPNKSDLIKHANDMYQKSDYLGYIVNYLLITINCRVMDLKMDLTTKQLGHNKNYLLISNDKAILVRNIYKTSKYYGQKTNEINDSRLIDSCKKILGQSSSVPLFRYEDNEEIENPSTVIRTKLLDKLSPTEYFKIIIKESDKNELILIERNRGTAVRTILGSYNVNQKY